MIKEMAFTYDAVTLSWIVIIIFFIISSLSSIVVVVTLIGFIVADKDEILLGRR